MFSSHLHDVLRCPCGLLRLPTHGLDIIDTSGRTPINRDKANPRKKKRATAGTNEGRRPLSEREEERETFLASSLTRYASARWTLL